MDLPLVQAINAHGVTAESREAIYNLFAACIHTIPLEELIASVERRGEKRSSGMQ
jgi:hypothetical protein